MADMTISIPCRQCCLHTTKLLNELETNNNVVCTYCSSVINLANEHWRTALRNARKAADDIESKPD